MIQRDSIARLKMTSVNQPQSGGVFVAPGVSPGISSEEEIPSPLQRGTDLERTGNRSDRIIISTPVIATLTTLRVLYQFSYYHSSTICTREKFQPPFEGSRELITCFLRYIIDPDKLVEFEHYARAWMLLIEKYGGTHHGYFVPGDGPHSAAFSFPGIGEQGPSNIAVAFFSFPNVEAYETYRREVANDPECLAATSHYEQTKCFIKYERTFMKPVPK